MESVDARVSWAVIQIEHSLAGPLEVGHLAASVNLSPSRFNYLFRRDVGISPARFVRLRRLERASELLETTFLSIKQVMAEVGLNDPSHFTRDFRSCHGLAPRAFRLARRHRPR